jgi:hypothetical protein
MTDSSHRQHGMSQEDKKNDTLDRELDAALSQYAAVEPRTGLEERVLANLRIERQHAARRAWWRWPAVAALAAAIVLAVSLLWRSESTLNITVQHPPAPAQTNDHAGTQRANNGGGGSNSRPVVEAVRTSKPHAVGHSMAPVASSPKLEQFPSPQPLSEQEKILARYVAKFPEHAALIAQARTEELRRDDAEEMGPAGHSPNENSQQWNK